MPRQRHRERLMGPVVASVLTGVLLLTVLATATTTTLMTSTAPGASAASDDHTPFGSEPTPLFSWPLPVPSAVVRPFDQPSTPYSAGHRGVDLAAVIGQDVVAAADGRVAFAGLVAGRGVVSIDHDAGLRTTYEPVRWSVSAGERVHRGQVVGTVAAEHPGCPERACLHWGVRRGDDYLDPLRFVRPVGALRLKPWIETSAPP
ncbi:M23 family metallopeptidase [Saccharomonospora sp. NB11]|uniref:M23 family metallopeptidase n=1 Tax=Saccharomonospora sp. NB11 TaxID=1642298 RepID=UPI0018D1CD0B|nr:M23 family metallopeptidase [Saccharomonospora sp. NB11]